MSFGECMSTRIFAAYLNKIGAKARQVSKYSHLVKDMCTPDLRVSIKGYTSSYLHVLNNMRSSILVHLLFVVAKHING